MLLPYEDYIEYYILNSMLRCSYKARGTHEQLLRGRHWSIAVTLEYVAIPETPYTQLITADATTSTWATSDHNLVVVAPEGN